MKFLRAGLPDVKTVVPARIGDTRGFFPEAWKDREVTAGGIPAGFAQDNHERDPRKGTLWGLRYGARHDNPVYTIPWPGTVETVLVSERDRKLRRHAQQPDLIEHSR